MFLLKGKGPMNFHCPQCTKICYYSLMTLRKLRHMEFCYSFITNDFDLILDAPVLKSFFSHPFHMRFFQHFISILQPLVISVALFSFSSSLYPSNFLSTTMSPEFYSLLLLLYRAILIFPALTPKLFFGCHCISKTNQDARQNPRAFRDYILEARGQHRST